MTIFRIWQSKSCEKLYMQRYWSQPLFSPDDMRDSHQIIISDMCEMIGRQPIWFDENNIVTIINSLYFPFDCVFKYYSFIYLTWRTESKHIIPLSLFPCPCSLLKFFKYFFGCLISPERIITVDTGSYFSLCLLFTDSIQFFCRHPTWICQSIF